MGVRTALFAALLACHAHARSRGRARDAATPSRALAREPLFEQLERYDGAAISAHYLRRPLEVAAARGSACSSPHGS